MGNQYKQLTLKERYHIEALSKLGFSARKIASEIKRGNKTVSIELKRCNCSVYCAEIANEQAQDKRRTSAKFSKSTETLKQSVRSALLLSLSPEQIAGRMKYEAVAEAVSCNTIYNLVKRERWQHLLTRKGKRYKGFSD